MAKSFEDSVNRIGYYNSELKVYALKEDANRKIGEYNCSKCDNELRNIEKANKEIRRISFKTKPIFPEKEIKHLEFQKYIEL